MITEEQQKIIGIFMKNVYGKKPDTSGSNPRHGGRGGHWLEKQMGIKQNASNEPDLLGHEMKSDTYIKTSFGDWNASYYIFRDEKFFPSPAETTGYGKSLWRKNKAQFLRIFGKENNGKFSWSGKPCPKRVTDGYNDFGQEMTVNDDNSISIRYSFSKDARPDKSKRVPERFRRENLIIVEWNSELIQKRVERKFNQKGWFKCIQDEDGVYRSIGLEDQLTLKSFCKWLETDMWYLTVA